MSYLKQIFTLLLCCIITMSLFSQNNDNSRIITKAKKSERQKNLESCIKKTLISDSLDQFHTCIREHRKLVLEVKDSLAYGKNLMYSGRYFDKKEKRDSAYYYYLKSLQLFKKLKDSSQIGRLLLNIAYIEKDISDYKSSENSSVEAIKYLKKGRYSYLLPNAYNNMGLVLNQLDDTINALKYHTKSLKLKREQRQVSKGVISSLNNIGKIYKDNKKYARAIQYFKEGLSHDSILDKNPKLKAIITDNYGYCLFKLDSIEKGFELMQEALQIREKGNFKDGLVASRINLALYYAKMHDTITAIQYGEIAEQISKETKDNRGHKTSLDLLANLHTGNKAKWYHNRHKEFSDSLNLEQNKVKEQHGRIKFEINEKYEQELAKQQQESRKTLRYILIVALLLLIVTLGFYVQKRMQKRRLQVIFLEGFRDYLIKKYNLTPENIDFWELWITGLGNKQMSEQLFISIEAVRSRRKSLRSKIDKIQTIEGNFTQTKATYIYNLEKDIFRNFDYN